MLIVRRLIFGLILILVVGLVPVAAQEGTATPQSHKDAVLMALADLSKGNPQTLYGLYADKFLDQGEENTLDSSVKYFISALMAAIPDLQIVPQVVIEQGDWVAGEISYKGTFTHPLTLGQAVQPTNKPVFWTEMDFIRFNSDGKIVESWGESDPSIMLSQLGMMPAQEQQVTGTALTGPAGFQTLSDSALAATFTSGMEARNQKLLQAMDKAVGVFPEYYTDPYVAWNTGRPYSVTAADSLQDKAFTDMINTALPGNTVDFNVVITEGDWTAVLGTLKGTFSADVDFMGTKLKHTGKELVWQIGAIDRYDADGKIVEEWIEGDATPLLQGLGVIPPATGS